MCRGRWSRKLRWRDESAIIATYVPGPRRSIRFRAVWPLAASLAAVPTTRLPAIKSPAVASRRPPPDPASTRTGEQEKARMGTLVAKVALARRKRDYRNQRPCGPTQLRAGYVAGQLLSA